MDQKNKSLKGAFLLDNGSLAGTFFARSVILICEHNEKGAYGLIVNKSVSTTIGSALAADLPQKTKNSPLFIGGPVQTKSLSFLYTSSEDSFHSVIKGVDLGHDLDDLQEISRQDDPLFKVKIFAGYSGWTSGQLENEIERDSWLILPSDSNQIYEEPHDTLWQGMLQALGWKYKLIADFPEDTSLN
ncbi:MAG: YqgE/AlgH family protein [Verrucomicrobiota bacterium]|nr:YqgE/AlgH family protein [Verrucomicrobiota bacterium]